MDASQIDRTPRLPLLRASRRNPIRLLAGCCLLALAGAQAAGQAPPAADTPYEEVLELRAEHSRTWSRPVPTTEPHPGEAPQIEERYVELAAGLHWNAAAAGEPPRWVPTRLDWEPQPDGSAAIVEAPRTVWLSSVLTGRPMLVVEPGPGAGPTLAFAFHGLAYLDRATDRLAWIGRVRAAALRADGFTAYYPDALEGILASWVVEHRLDGLSAGLVLHELPPPPEEYGYRADDSVDLIVVSELMGLRESVLFTFRDHAVQPTTVQVRLTELGSLASGYREIRVSEASEPGDHLLTRSYATWTEGEVALGIGKAADEGDRIEVYTGLARSTEGRILLYEGFSAALLRARVGTLLPPSQGASAGTSWRRLADAASSAAAMPLGGNWAGWQEARRRRALFRELGAPDARQSLLARAEHRSGHSPIKHEIPPGLFIDYETISAGTLGDLAFESGKTYYISGAVTVTSSLTIEGGAVVKLGGAGKVALSGAAAVLTHTEPWDPASFVSKNCDDIGARISGSTGVPSYGDYQRALILDSAAGGALRCLRVAHAWQGIEVLAGAWDLRHMVLRACGTGLSVREPASVYVGNAMVDGHANYSLRFYLDGSTAGSPDPQLDVEHLTVLGPYWNVLRCDLVGGAQQATARFRSANSVWLNYTNMVQLGSGSISWQATFEHCGLGHATNPPANQRIDCEYLAGTTADYYASAQTGGYYLARQTQQGAANPLVNRGSTSARITALLAGRSAVLPMALPQALYRSSHDLPLELGLAPRDGDQGPADTPDLGYHYPAVDAIVGASGLVVRGDLRVGPGRLFATAGTVTADASGRLEIWGAPEAAVVLVPWWQISDRLRGYRPTEAADQFTGLWITEGADTGNRLEHAVFSGFHWAAVVDPRRLPEVAHCRFAAHQIGLYPYNADGQGTLPVRNCLFLGRGDGTSYGVWTYGNGAAVSCSTFGRATFPMSSGQTGPLSAVNSLFSGYFSMAVAGNFDHCGFWSCVLCLPPGATNVRQCAANPFAEGPLGRYYLNAVLGGGDLLRGHAQDPAKGGTGTADSYGLYPYTVDPDQNPAGASEVSIGYHYATQLDSDEDGAWDATEDTNGDGMYETELDRSDFTELESTPSWLRDEDGDGLPDEDEDRDGLLDDWEMRQGLSTQRTGDPYDSNGAAGDPDADGKLNADEWALLSWSQKPGCSGHELQGLLALIDDLSVGLTGAEETSPDCQGIQSARHIEQETWSVPCAPQNPPGFIFEVPVEARVELYDTGYDLVCVNEHLYVTSIDHPAKEGHLAWTRTPAPPDVNPCEMATVGAAKKQRITDQITLSYDTVDPYHHTGACAEIAGLAYVDVAFDDEDQLYGWDDFTVCWHPNCHYCFKSVPAGGAASTVRANFEPALVKALDPAVVTSTSYAGGGVLTVTTGDAGQTEVLAQFDDAAFEDLGYDAPNAFRVLAMPDLPVQTLVIVRVSRPGLPNLQTLDIAILQQRVDEIFGKQAHVPITVIGCGGIPCDLVDVDYDIQPPNGMLDTAVWAEGEPQVIWEAYGSSGLPQHDYALFLIDAPANPEVSGIASVSGIYGFLFRSES